MSDWRDRLRAVFLFAVPGLTFAGLVSAASDRDRFLRVLEAVFAGLAALEIDGRKATDGASAHRAADCRDVPHPVAVLAL
jgi:hypothetical protein